MEIIGNRRKNVVFALIFLNLLQYISMFLFVYVKKNIEKVWDIEKFLNARFSLHKSPHFYHFQKSFVTCVWILKGPLFLDITWNNPMQIECPIVHQGHKVRCSAQKTWPAWNLLHPIIFSVFFLDCKIVLTMKIQEQSKGTESKNKILPQQA